MSLEIVFLGILIWVTILIGIMVASYHIIKFFVTRNAFMVVMSFIFCTLFVVYFIVKVFTIVIPIIVP